MVSHKKYSRLSDSLPLERLGVSRIIDKFDYGGFADLYHCEGIAGDDLALKVFRTKAKDGLSVPSTATVREIIDNVTNRKEVILAYDGFVRLHAISEPGEPACYTTSYFNQSVSVGQYISFGIGIKNQLTGKILLGLAECLTYLHERELLFGDLGWGNVLIGKGEGGVAVKVCDFDTVQMVGTSRNNPLYNVKKPNVQPREKLFGYVATFQGEIQSFVYLINLLFFKYPFVGSTVKFLPNYPEKERTQLPCNLGELVEQVTCSEFGVEGITAKQFVAAIKADYGL